MSGSKFLLGAVIGGLVGAGLGVLFAPRRGDETRAELANWRADGDGAPPADGSFEQLLDLAAGVVRASMDRFDLARHAARQATDDTERALTEEWEQRRRSS